MQESGLLKDDIRLDFPVEAGRFDIVLLARATRKAKRATELWRAYAQREGAAAEAVVPLLVVQVPNRPSDQLLLSACATIRESWPELGPEAMAHVFGEHAPIELGGFTVPHVGPETVQDRTHIRVLFAKDAISTGWDCPRAPRSLCRSVPPGTIPTSPSFSGGWSVRRWLGACPATTC